MFGMFNKSMSEKELFDLIKKIRNQIFETFKTFK